MFDYGNTDYEKLFLFARMLLPQLQFGREREGIDLSALRPTHHKMHDFGQQKLNLAGVNVPAQPLVPITEAGSRQVQDKHRARAGGASSRRSTTFSRATSRSRTRWSSCRVWAPR